MVNERREQLGPLFSDIGAFLAEGDFSPAMKAALDEIKLAVAGNFAASQTALGAPWAPRRQPTGDWPLLIKTTRMVASILGDAVGLVAEGTAQGQSEHFEEVGPRHAIIATQNPYAQSHDKGNPNRNLPARPFMHVNADTADKAAEIVFDFMVERLAEMLNR